MREKKRKMNEKIYIRTINSESKRHTLPLCVKRNDTAKVDDERETGGDEKVKKL